MKKYLWCFFLAFFVHYQSGYTQSFKVKPYLAYSQVRMDDVNRDIANRVGQLRNIVDQPLLIPEKLNGNYGWGIQVQYHLGENYFLNLNTYFFQEETKSEYFQEGPPNTVNFLFKRQIEYIEASAGLKYYLGYNTWKRVNFYLGGGIGVGFGWTDALTKYTDGTNTVDNSGQYSSTALIANFMGGAEIRLTPYFSLFPEAGYRLANLQQMNGRISVNQDFPGIPNGRLEASDSNYTPEEIYDFSGFFISLGIGFILPFI
jgi:opacity protein-like surface antigen